MIKKERKIKRINFPSFKDERFSVNGKILRFQCYPRRQGEQNTLFTVVVPKKYYSTTVERNIFKRRVFSCLSGLFDQFDKGKYGRIVVYPLVKLKGNTFQMISLDIDQCVILTS